MSKLKVKNTFVLDCFYTENNGLNYISDNNDERKHWEQISKKTYDKFSFPDYKILES